MKRALTTMMHYAAVAVAAVLLTGVPAGAKEPATVKIPVKAELYATAPQPLTTAQCGQCHESHFARLKNDGGRHRFECQQCHAIFHAYNPTKGVAAYQELMPQCAGCHTLPHGKTVTDCANCHNDPHAIKKPVMGARLAGACASCHAKPKAELTENPSKHSKVECDACHTAHGFKPSCNACHQPHSPEQGFDTCTKCHPVHKPKLVTYGADIQNGFCASCHGAVAGKLKGSASKHATVTCVACHRDRHKAIPECAACHHEPHPKVFLDMYPKCLSCHLDPHDLPTKGRK